MALNDMLPLATTLYYKQVCCSWQLSWQSWWFWWCWWYWCSWWWWWCRAIMLSLAGTKPACRRGKTIISILGEKYGREIQGGRKLKRKYKWNYWYLQYSWRQIEPWKCEIIKREEMIWKWVKTELRRKEPLQKRAKTLQQIFTFSIGKQIFSNIVV